MSAYSQYSYSQYQTQSQQLQQQNAASATPSMTWNGVQWVAAVPSAAVATVGGGAPPAPQAPPGHTIPPPTSTPTAFVTAYSLFYQEWKNQSQQQAQLAATLPPGERQEEARRLTIPRQVALKSWKMKKSLLRCDSTLVTVNKLFGRAICQTNTFELMPSTELNQYRRSGPLCEFRLLARINKNSL